MTTGLHLEQPCRKCGGPIRRPHRPRGGRTRIYCHSCRPPERSSIEDAPCRTCGNPIDRNLSKRPSGRRRVHCHSCRPPVGQRAVVADADLDDPAMSPTLRAALKRVVDEAAAAGWSQRVLSRTVRELRAVVASRAEGQQLVHSSAVHAVLGVTFGARVERVERILAEVGLLVDDVDTVPTMHAWIDRTCAAMPAGFRAEVRAWLATLHEGDERSRPRSNSTVY